MTEHKVPHAILQVDKSASKCIPLYQVAGS